MPRSWLFTVKKIIKKLNAYIFISQTLKIHTWNLASYKMPRNATEVASTEDISLKTSDASN